jgi:RND family efflux transporter MFP subunit
MSHDPAQPNPPRRRLRLVTVAMAGCAALIVFTGVTSRREAYTRLSHWTEEQAIPVVAVALPNTRPARTGMDFPGRLEAYSQAQLFARVSGYIREWKADIGAPVKAGQPLAEIDAPDLDQQIMQAKADLASAQANVALAKATMDRGNSLIGSGAVSKADLDQRIADYENKQGLVGSAQANLDRLRVLEKYKSILAPFDGLVTARATDVGALINAGSGGGPALFVVSDVSRLRAYINVPQNVVPSIRIGSSATISVPEYPGKRFPATVEASAQAVDVASGTTRMQLVVDNAQRELMTGSYANVRVELPTPSAAISVAASALIFDRSGLRIATVGEGDRVVFKPVMIARDLGNEIEIASGLAPEDRVITTPPDGIAAGDQVRIAEAKPARALPATASNK